MYDLCKSVANGARYKSESNKNVKDIPIVSLNAFTYSANEHYVYTLPECSSGVGSWITSTRGSVLTLNVLYRYK